jgi:hypothetical protein
VQCHLLRAAGRSLGSLLPVTRQVKEWVEVRWDLLGLVQHAKKAYPLSSYDDILAFLFSLLPPIVCPPLQYTLYPEALIPQMAAEVSVTLLLLPTDRTVPAVSSRSCSCHRRISAASPNSPTRAAAAKSRWPQWSEAHSRCRHQLPACDACDACSPTLGLHPHRCRSAPR